MYKNGIELSIIIPARNEEFLARTIQDILEHVEANTEVIAVLDGTWADPAISQHERVNIIYVPEAVGQRAAGNLGVKLAKGKYVMKVDAHCSFDQGFDRKMIEFFNEVGDDVTAVPIMKNLHVFDWKCYSCGWKVYQDKLPQSEENVCQQCGEKNVKKKMVWQAKRGINSVSYCFDAEPKFSYFEEWKHRPQFIKDKAEKGYTETMSLQGSCFMLSREKYWELNICDETLGNWGNQGIEVACKTWLSGGRVLVNHRTWYSHCFRTKSEFGFPWPVSGNDQNRTKKKVRDQLWEGRYDKAIYPVSWLVEKFWPVKGWTDEDLQKLKELEASQKST